MYARTAVGQRPMEQRAPLGAGPARAQGQNDSQIPPGHQKASSAQSGTMVAGKASEPESGLSFPLFSLGKNQRKQGRRRQDPVTEAPRKRIATPVCALVRNDRLGSCSIFWVLHASKHCFGSPKRACCKMHEPVISRELATEKSVFSPQTDAEKERISRGLSK